MRQYPMGSKSPEARLQSLLKQDAELKRKIRAQQKEVKERERKQRSTMLIAYGLLVLQEIKEGKRTEEEVKKSLDKILTQNSHRSAVGLTLLGSAGNKKLKEEKPQEIKKEQQEKKAPYTSPKRTLPEKYSDNLENEFS